MTNPTTKIETITPALAVKYLAILGPEQRPLRPSSIENFAGLIRRGEWILTHQGIAFDAQNRLVDGQHRLHAIIQADVPVQIMVTRGVPDGSYRWIDAGRPRTVGDRLKLLSDPKANQTACAIVRAYAIATARYVKHGVGGLTVDLIDNLFLEMPEQYEEVALAFQKRVPGLVRADVGAALVCYLSMHEHPAREFLHGYLAGEGFRRDDPPFALREAILMKRIPPTGASIHVGYWKAIFATRAHFESRPARNVQTATKDWRGNEPVAQRHAQARRTAQGLETKLQTTTPEQRSEIGRKAVQAREAKKKAALNGSMPASRAASGT